MAFNHPLHLSFKILAFAPQILVTDAAGTPILYVRQKLLKLREAVQVFRDDSKQEHLYDIKADRIIDFSAKDTFSTPDGRVLGAVKRSGMRSLFAAHYTVYDGNDQPAFEIQQTNPWVGVADAFLGEIPIVGLFMGYIFNPVYAVTRIGSSERVMSLTKKRTFLDTGFGITKDAGSLTDAEELNVLLSAITVTLRERERS